jgi:hypothetical protein
LQRRVRGTITVIKANVILFSNPGRIKSGDKVTVIIGDFRMEELIVE